MDYQRLAVRAPNFSDQISNFYQLSTINHQHLR